MNPSPPCVVCLGEVLWDLLPSGPQLGGAPANLACHVAQLGGTAILLSRVGRDDRGRKARAGLRDRGVRLELLQEDPILPTGTVSVELDDSGHPRFTIVEHVAWDHLEATPDTLDAVRGAMAVCFGTLAQRSPVSRQTIGELLQASPPGALRLCDINLRDPFHTPEVIESSLRAANALKLNETELPVLGRIFGFPGEPRAAVEALATRFNLGSVLLTLGAAGSRVWSDGRWVAESGRNVAVRDTVGAGDSFTAAFVLARLLHWPMADALKSATEIAAYVCTQSGATPELPPELKEPFHRLTSERQPKSALETA
ncbi:MAG: carbohydrate kinase [Verrucomicrobiales bacterium]|nr:carbohydrate kinase [Verrucomicrobiales bacterium]